MVYVVLLKDSRYLYLLLRSRRAISVCEIELILHRMVSKSFDARWDNRAHVQHDLAKIALYFFQAEE